MFPIRDHNPASRTPIVTTGLIIINVIVFVMTLPYMADERLLYVFFDHWALIPAKVTTGQDFSGLFTHMFLHGGFLHLAGNMLFLWIFGDNLEDVLGHVGFLIFYIAAGLGAALLQIAAAPFDTTPMVGASGAIAGVMGGYLLLFPKARVDVLFIFFVFIRILPVPAWFMLAFWFAIQVINGSAAVPGTGGVAYWAHAGGFLVGFLWVLPAWLRRGGPQFWQRSHGHPQHPAAHYRMVRSDVPVVRRRPRR